MTGHLDSRCTDVLDFTSDAPGADDDGSGVAVVLELARVFSAATTSSPARWCSPLLQEKKRASMARAHMATVMKSRQRHSGHVQQRHRGRQQIVDGSRRPFTLRLFVEGVPDHATSNDIAILQATGGENDSSRASSAASFRTRAVQPDEHEHPDDLAARPLPARQRPRLVRDTATPRRGSPSHGENFNHEHQNVQVVNGVQFGDLIDFVDFDYIARVARVNAATLWALATGPGTPKNLRIHTTPPGTLSGTNLTTLFWDANPESNLAKYEVVKRETTSADWTDVIDVGNVTTVTLDISKDNVQFGLRAVDTAGNRSPVAFPIVVN